MALIPDTGAPLGYGAGRATGVPRCAERQSAKRLRRWSRRPSRPKVAPSTWRMPFFRLSMECRTYRDGGQSVSNPCGDPMTRNLLFHDAERSERGCWRKLARPAGEGDRMIALGVSGGPRQPEVRQGRRVHRGDHPLGDRRCIWCRAQTSRWRRPPSSRRPGSGAGCCHWRYPRRATAGRCRSRRACWRLVGRELATHGEFIADIRYTGGIGPPDTGGGLLRRPRGRRPVELDLFVDDLWPHRQQDVRTSPSGRPATCCTVRPAPQAGGESPPGRAASSERAPARRRRTSTCGRGVERVGVLPRRDRTPATGARPPTLTGRPTRTLPCWPTWRRRRARR